MNNGVLMSHCTFNYAHLYRPFSRSCFIKTENKMSLCLTCSLVKKLFYQTVCRSGESGTLSPVHQLALAKLKQLLLLFNQQAICRS